MTLEKVIFQFYVPARHGAQEVTRHFVSPRGTSCESPAPEEVSSGHLSFLKLNNQEITRYAHTGKVGSWT